MEIVFSLLLLACLAITNGEQIVENTTEEKQNSSDSHSRPGKWFNQGSSFSFCEEEEKRRDVCESFSLHSPPLEKSTIQSADCEKILHKIACSLSHLSCERNPKSFQMYDLPCQASCFAAVMICGKSPSSLFRADDKNIPTYENFIADQYGKRLFQRSEQTNQQNTGVWPWNQEVNRKSLAEKQARYPRYQRHMITRPQYTYKPRQWRNGATYYPTRRTRRNLPINRYNTTPFSRNRRAMRQNYPYYPNAMQLEFNQRPYLPIRNSALMKQCLHLPTGGCEDWSNPLLTHSMYNFNQGSFRSLTKSNKACPTDIDSICKNMFPQKFSHEKWLKGNYTVVAIIKIVQTVWWFGSNEEKYQPMFRFSIQETLQSDIHPYDPKSVLTHAWPLRCMCPHEITVGKKYLMLTHSKLSRHKLDINKDSIFLSKVKRYSRKFRCWAMGNCKWRRRFNRRTWKSAKNKFNK